MKPSKKEGKIAENSGNIHFLQLLTTGQGSIVIYLDSITIITTIKLGNRNDNIENRFTILYHIKEKKHKYYHRTGCCKETIAFANAEQIVYQNANYVCSSFFLSITL